MSSTSVLTVISSTTPDLRASLSSNSAYLQSRRLVTWGILWQRWASVGLYAFGGLIAAIVHHVYYSKMSGTTVTNTDSQQWTIRFGTALAFFTIALLRAALVGSYEQYIWRIFRHKSISIRGIDKITSLNSNLTGFCCLELYKQAWLAVGIAALGWCLPLAGLTPPSTLSIVPGLLVDMYSAELSVIDWSDAGWASSYSSNGAATQIPRVGAQTAGGRTILPLQAPAVNSSYSVHFYGPSLQCGGTDASHQSAFDYYTARALNESGTVTYAQAVEIFDDRAEIIPEFKGATSFLVYSAFVPDIGWFSNGEFLPSMPASLLWSPELPIDYTREQEFLQLWFQTAGNSIVCSLTNTSFDLDIEFLNGTQSITQREIYTVSPWTPTELTSTESNVQDQAYLTTFVTFVNTLSGNVTLQQAFGTELSLKLDDSNVLNTALSACPEFTLWFDTTTFRPTNSSIYGINLSGNITNYVFPNDPSICRNGSLPRAIEDLANNITISMLGNADLTVQREGPVNISIPCNVYQYDNLNLVISYTGAIIATIFSVAIGMFALYENGVSHSTSFSAILNTTRSTRLSDLTQGNSLGAEPLANDLGDLRLRFGLLDNEGDEKASPDGDLGIVRQAGFGVADHVDKLRRGQVCF
ncbi:hypothetical protein MMC11_006270 [Xylographa trunciseda]|nr:hypothetical protein [Xylographa trunciseda]